MQCPICDRSLSTITHLGVEIESCSHCNGAWFDKNELSDYLQKIIDRANKGPSPKKYSPIANPDLVIEGGGFCPKCNQVVEYKTLSGLGIKILKCYGCQGAWVRISHLAKLADWYATATSLQKLDLFDQEFRTWDVDNDAPLVSSFLNLIEDDNPRRNFPLATAFIIIINIVIFIWYNVFPENAESLMLVPLLLFNEPVTYFSQLFTSMFMHAGILHLLGNMYFLWVFGDNIEDRIGVSKYISLYLVCGIVADFTHALMTNNPEIPTLGASGAISGILGGYLLLYPKARVTLFTLIYFQPLRLSLPVWFYLGVWFLGQQALSIAIGVPGVAWYAHIGGFVFGFLSLFVMKTLRQL